MHFTLKQLDVFVAVAMHGSTLAAAKSLAISQPAVSQSLSELESRLGTQLFDRWKKKVVLNEHGRAALPMARLLLVNARELDAILRNGRQPLSGTLRLGASLTIANYVLPEFLDHFTKEHPPVKLEVSCRNKQRIIALIENFSVDIGLVAGTCNSCEVQSSLWLQDELCVFASPDHPLAQQSCVTIEALYRQHWIMREEGSGTREVFLKSLQDRTQPLNIVMEFESSEAIKRAVEIGKGVSCLSRMAVKRELAAGILKEVPIPGLSLARKYYLLTHKQRQRSPLLQAFIHFCGGAPSVATEI